MRSWRVDESHTGRWTLVFDRPGASHNSLDTAALMELDEVLGRVEAAPDGVSQLVLASGKPRGFCAGADLRHLRAFAKPAEVADFCRLGQRVFARLAALEVPTIAVIQGVCLGGGLELAMHCRYRLLIDDEAEPKLGTPEVLLGLVPAWGAISDLPRLIGLRSALELLVEGDSVGAARALALGLVDGMSPRDRLEANLDAFGGDGLIRTVAPWPPGEGPLAVAEQRERARADGPPRGPARLELLDVLELDWRDGRAAALDAVADCLAQRIFEPETRRALDAFFAHRKA